MVAKKAAATTEAKTTAKKRRFSLRRKAKLSPDLRLITVRQLLRESWQLLRANWKLFGGIGLIYAISYRIFVEGVSRLNIDTDKLGDEGSWGDLTVEVGLTATSAIDSSGPGGSMASLYASLLTILFSLAVVWSVRQLLAGRKIRIRDALYNSAAPLLPVMAVLGIIFVQLIPMVLGIFIYIAATVGGIAQGSLETSALFVVAMLTTLLSCYWLSSSIMGLAAVTLPGIYPFAALRAAKGLVAGRRWQIFLRLVVYALIVLVAWAVAVILTISNPLTGLFVNEVLGLMRALTLVLSSVLIYKLYRSLVDEA